MRLFNGFLLLSLGVAGCATGPRETAAPAPTAVSNAPQARTENVNAGRPALPPVAPPYAPSAQTGFANPEIRLVSHEQAAEPLPAPPLKPANIGLANERFPIDFPTVLRLADADNLQVASAREQIQQAYAEYRQANVLWLPSLRAGAHFHHHDGTLQGSGGNIVDVSRSSVYAGQGAQAVGAGSPAVPGIFANFNLADAIFQPLAAQQRWGAREQAASATRNNILLDVSLAYIELLRAAQDVAIAIAVRDQMSELSRVTGAYARTGQGLQADADRMLVELGLRENDIRRSQEALLIASARLAQLLRLQPCIQLEPLEPFALQLCLIPQECECCDLVAEALLNRPELAQNRYLVGEAAQRLRRERYAPLVPSVLLGASYGGFGGGLGSDINTFKDRFDVDLNAFWELRNLGAGEIAARDGAGSRLRQAQLQELAVMDQVARDVTEAYGQVRLRGQQIETSRDVVRFANDSYTHNFARIQAGQGLPIEVLQSIQALLQARREYLRSVTDFNAAQFTLQRALGWPVGHVEPMTERPPAEPRAS